MIPTIFVTAGAAAFAIYKIITLMYQNELLRAENDKLKADNQSLRGQINQQKVGQKA